MPKQIETVPTAPPPHGFTRLVSVAKVGESGMSLTVAPGSAALPKIAAYLELETLKRLSATVEVMRWRHKGIKLTGHFTADVTQSCVVTLEPIEAQVEGDFERRFLPPAGYKHAESDALEISVDPEGVDPPEVLGREIDVGEILVEELSLALDPYPRRPGVEFTPEQDTVVKPVNPFAVLAKLQGKAAKNKRKP